MANKDYDSKYNRGMARERVHANNSWRTYDGDSPQDRDSQHRAWSGGDMGTRGERLRGPGRFGQQRSTQDFENENARQFNRGREGDQEWRLSDYDVEDYMADNPAHEYGEQRGFSAYGRAKYDPDINRGWEEPNGRERSQRYSHSYTDRYRNDNDYSQEQYEDDEQEQEQPIPYASHKNGFRAHGRTGRPEYVGNRSNAQSSRSGNDRYAASRDRMSSGSRRSRKSSTSSLVWPIVVLGGFAVVAGVMQAVAPRVFETIGGIFSKSKRRR